MGKDSTGLNLTLARTDEISHAAKSMVAQMEIVSDGGSTMIRAVKSEGNKHPLKISLNQMQP